MVSFYALTKVLLFLGCQSATVLGTVEGQPLVLVGCAQVVVRALPSSGRAVRLDPRQDSLPTHSYPGELLTMLVRLGVVAAAVVVAGTNWIGCW